MEVIEDRARESRLLELLQKYHKSRKNRVLVFVLYKKEASRVEEKLQRAGWKVHLVSLTFIYARSNLWVTYEERKSALGAS